MFRFLTYNLVFGVSCLSIKSVSDMGTRPCPYDEGPDDVENHVGDSLGPLIGMTIAGMVRTQ